MTALVIGAPGTNRQRDAAFAFEQLGMATAFASVESLVHDGSPLRHARIVMLAGGFSYADALGAGRLWALDLTERLGDAVRGVVARGVPVLGVCNGFQALVAAGLLPGSVPSALEPNAHGQFACHWVTMRPVSTRCVWTRDLAADDAELQCPIAHGEGRFRVAPDDVAALAANDQIALRYGSANPNGSVDGIAGVCDETGLVLGLMPHPENHVVRRQHPQSRHGHDRGSCVPLFAAGVRHVA
jgi:phosphoribosylformylglycinamidine synthase subunit PurQ / glutaminase